MTMRTILSIVAIVVILGGCAGTHKVRMPDQTGTGSSHTTPVVLQPPPLSAKRKYQRDQNAEMAYKDSTKVEGNLVR